MCMLGIPIGLGNLGGFGKFEFINLIEERSQFNYEFLQKDLHAQLSSPTIFVSPQKQTFLNSNSNRK